jgi:hypothetical protein
VTSLLGRLLRLFPESVPLEDLFTEAVARLFERRPGLCLAWLKEAELLPAARVATVDEGYVRVSTQRRFGSLEHQDTASRPDLLIEVHWPPQAGPAGGEVVADVVMVESKIGSKEGQEQLRRYAEHLGEMTDFGGKTLAYITRTYDPKDPNKVLSGLGADVRFVQLRWHDFYRFLQKVAEQDALVEEAMAFMEEQGMARSYRFSTTDLMALSGVPRAFEIFDETLGGEVKNELESFAGRQPMRETQSIRELRWHQRYNIRALLHDWNLFCDVGYQLGRVDESAYSSILRLQADGYPAIFTFLEAQPGAEGRETSVAAMRQIALDEDWEAYNLEDPASWAGVRRVRSLASVLQEEDHVAAVQRFFVESIHQLRENLRAVKKEHPDLPWEGGEPPRSFLP